MAQTSKKFIIWFKDIRLKDVPKVGGKTAALGEMYANLTKRNINIPDGFAITAGAYRYFLRETGLDREIKTLLAGLKTSNLKDLQRRGKAVRELIVRAELPADLKREIRAAYRKLERKYGKNVDTAVRSSATAEDLPGVSFAGQHETFLNVSGADEVLLATKRCIASLFKDRAISYRADKGFAHSDVALSVGVQKMVRSDLAASGVIFTIDTETGFDKVVVVNASWGLGEMVVQGKVLPDEFVVFKPTLAQGFKAVIAQNLGKKTVKLVYADSPRRSSHGGGGGTRKVAVSARDQNRFCLTEDEVLTLARWSVVIEEHFSKLHKREQPMDIEWAKDGKSGELFIVQARPETVHAMESKKIYREYRLADKVLRQAQDKILAEGVAVGTKIGVGKARVIQSVRSIGAFKPGEVLVTEVTDPDWEPIMKIAAAIVTDKGGRTSHAAIVSRELGIPCIVGAGNATRKLKTGQVITVDCSGGETGHVYQGKLPFEIKEHHLDKLPKPKVKIMVNIGAPDEAFKNHYLPVNGVGLGRLEFIIASHIKIHPNALLEYQKLKTENFKLKTATERLERQKLIRKIDELTPGYKDKIKFYVDELAEGIAKIAAAFYPREVIIRFSDFKTNEYRKLVGGELYEPVEENPMLGWRGASRYYDSKFEKAFGLEVKALRRVREKFGLTNVVPMVPFCRTPEEGRKVIAVMEKYGLHPHKSVDIRINPRLNQRQSASNNPRQSAPNPRESALQIYVMCEIPSNILLADEFLDVFDGMSIGSNDLTQLVLGLDRDSGTVSHIANENDPAVRKMIAEVIAKCRTRKKYSGICGQAPSDYPDFAAFLIKQGIESISLNPDTVIKTILRLAKSRLP
ncbi:phosphoenolpyruvate synthase [Candidatus Jorgensenbacteria bacterium CG23_combo_of_CG06-09_8_20_14_all_54_14]|uniref:Phosphoenolpyruvate synthase n=1 Tax=Candidatus Jorgensenbacteria bacterium CG23_combo_of_CG06-09_8_20_14_all_54_14 TaxID=1974595 RepID=A0A2G9Z977_9BACT|nr:MAG: phosphoenolpyruvate synthase [Candidatus Jorgensenbacteria bacterium CG23_combo_of_CG06-09_8_20_14_all_54_14]